MAVAPHFLLLLLNLFWSLFCLFVISIFGNLCFSMRLLHGSWARTRGGGGCFISIYMFTKPFAPKENLRCRQLPLSPLPVGSSGFGVLWLYIIRGELRILSIVRLSWCSCLYLLQARVVLSGEDPNATPIALHGTILSTRK